MRIGLGLSMTGVAARARAPVAPFPYPGAAIDIDFARQRYWWGGAEKTQANFTTFNLNGSTLSSRGLQALDATIDITLSLSGLGSLVPGSMAVVYENVANTATAFFAEYNNGTVQERVALLKASNGIPQISIIDNNVTQANPGVTGPSGSGRHGFAMSYDVNSFLLAADGIAGTADVSGTLPTVTTLMLGKAANGTPLTNAWLRRFISFTASKPQGVLNTLSSQLQYNS